MFLPTLRIMRLINVETRNLEEFFGHQIPPYAILSHTWGKNQEEVCLREMGSTNASNKPGYQKIEYLCQQAARDKLRWAWCDTCCIDKSSSAELSESINSMFQWYMKADVCYVYLADVLASKDNRNTMDQLRVSRWFTRGWTLQELLAPKKVFFYDKNWEFIGSKSILIEDLTDISGINFGALSSPWTLPSYSIATRMSWASKRITTRTEDQAYCMLGILGVNMPLLYGEGQNAFRRLQEQLISISDDESIFAHSGPNVLATCPQEFSSGHYLTILKKDTSAPYSITNAGLHIHMRVLTLEVSATHDRVSALGILNCHYNNSASRNLYLALPLEPTGMDSTYRKVPSSIQYVPFDQATSLEYRTIFIQLRAAQISRITLLEDYDLSQYSSQVHSAGSITVYNSNKREVRIYPTPPFKYEATLHTFQTVQNIDCQPFGVITFFDLISDRVGVLVLPSYSLNPENHAQRHMDTNFETWKNQGQPASDELCTPSAVGGPRRKIRVMAIQKRDMAQFVWSLQIVEGGVSEVV
jgi:hypothetical protein